MVECRRRCDLAKPIARQYRPPGVQRIPWPWSSGLVPTAAKLRNCAARSDPVDSLSLAMSGSCVEAFEADEFDVGALVGFVGEALIESVAGEE